MYLDFLSAIVSKNRLNPIMQKAKNDRSVLRALPVYDNGELRSSIVALPGDLFIVFVLCRITIME